MLSVSDKIELIDLHQSIKNLETLTLRHPLQQSFQMLILVKHMIRLFRFVYI